MCPASKMRPWSPCGPVWRYADRDHFACARSEALDVDRWFARSGLVTVCPYVAFAPAHIHDVNCVFG